MVDPALAMANTFNQAPSMMSLEFLGIVKPVEEKSDAEIRAEQVVAANKEEQDKIVMLSWHLIDVPLPSIMRSRMKKIANVKVLIV